MLPQITLLFLFIVIQDKRHEISNSEDEEVSLAPGRPVISELSLLGILQDADGILLTDCAAHIQILSLNETLCIDEPLTALGCSVLYLCRCRM